MNTPPAPPIADRPEMIDAAWLTAALRSTGMDATVATVDVTPIGTGQMGTTVRLDISYAERAGDTELPDTLVAKLPSPDDAHRAMVAGIHRTEVEFYRRLAPTLAVAVPRCRYSDISEDHQRFILLLDDASPRVQGDQIGGCSTAAARAAVVNLAGLHGPRWCDPTLIDEGWSATSDDEAEGIAEIARHATELFLDRYAGRISAEDAALLREVPRHLGAWLVARSERFAPLHGDYRLDNLLIDIGAESSAHTGLEPVWAVDWQTVTLGLPGRDLAYFLETGLAPTDRRAHEHELVAAYHAALETHGVRDHSVDECFEDYRLGTLQGPLITIVGAAYGAPTERGDEMFLTMAARSCAAIRDLDPVALL